MEPTQENFNALVHYISESINPLPERRLKGTPRACMIISIECNIFKGEEFLNSVSAQPGFLLLLLRLQEIKTVEPAFRLGAALYFKNFVKKNWSQVVVITSMIHDTTKYISFCFLLLIHSFRAMTSSPSQTMTGHKLKQSLWTLCLVLNQALARHLQRHLALLARQSSPMTGPPCYPYVEEEREKEQVIFSLMY